MERDRILPVHLNCPIVLLTALFVLMTCGPGAAVAPGNGGSSPIAVRYQEAKDYYLLLLRDEQVRGDRRNWLRCVGDFRRIYADEPRGEFAPGALFTLAKLYYRMYMQFADQADLDESIANYDHVWTTFPDNSLADDALFWSAEIHLKDRKDPDRAAELYALQVKRFPDGDKYSQALSRLREIDAEFATGLPALLTGPDHREDLVAVLPVKYWSSDDYSRIVISSSSAVSYTSTLAAMQEGRPRKLHIDFSQSAIEARYAVPVGIQEGLLQKIHSVQLDPTTVRVNLEVEAISSYKIFSLNDPFRVIVDIHGPQKIITASKTLPELHQERIAALQSGPLPALEPVRKKSSPAGRRERDASIPEEQLIVLQGNHKRIAGLSISPGEDGSLAALSLAQQLGLGVRRIVIDPGHGGKDPGAMAHGLKEKDIVLQVAKKTAQRLRSTYAYDVILTREDDRTLPLEERTAIANTAKADLFISIHVNAHPRPTTRGIETFFLNLATNSEAMRVAARENATSAHNISDLQDILTDLMQNSKIQESSILAEYVQNSLVSGLLANNFQTRDLGVKQAPFYVLIGAEMPSILAEISFISNPGDAGQLRQEKYLDAIAGRIAAGVAGYVEHQATAALQL
ncbi:MAG: N-acetylmuramoyl-L-alanine amidase [Desulfobulbaceae bacterium]|jgi:N-acetylmuramoyl-L-alanine amidase|nr:N-acetylmuramoyl-L-alanine amidase [Desulfobulbaceae bacterium]